MQTYHKVQAPFKEHVANDLAIKSITAGQLANYYGFPLLSEQSSECVAIVELGGGYSPKDVTDYCSEMGIPVPPIKVVSIDGAQNSYSGDPNSADGEVALDIQNILGATMGKVGIVLYFCQNTGPSFAKAIMQVAKDGLACACSISWGAPEKSWSKSDITLMESAFAACAANGISVFAASGDSGSGDGLKGNNVDYPASSPQVFGCGGTTVNSNNLSYSETAWGNGGGGYSSLFPRPSYQSAAHTNAGRGVPDIAADADPSSGYPIIMNGQSGIIGGTSAVSPMWSALTALLVQTLGHRLGFYAPKLYAMKPKGFVDILTGTNGSFKARGGWDECTGLGTPIGAQISGALGTPVPPNPVPPNPVPPNPVPPSPQPSLTVLQTILPGTYTLTPIQNHLGGGLQNIIQVIQSVMANWPTILQDIQAIIDLLTQLGILTPNDIESKNLFDTIRNILNNPQLMQLIQLLLQLIGNGQTAQATALLESFVTKPEAGSGFATFK